MYDKVFVCETKLFTCTIMVFSEDGRWFDKFDPDMDLKSYFTCYARGYKYIFISILNYYNVQHLQEFGRCRQFCVEFYSIVLSGFNLKWSIYTCTFKRKNYLFKIL